VPGRQVEPSAQFADFVLAQAGLQQERGQFAGGFAAGTIVGEVVGVGTVEDEGKTEFPGLLPTDAEKLVLAVIRSAGDRCRQSRDLQLVALDHDLADSERGGEFWLSSNSYWG
jgi:hypothetical protein